MRKPAIALFAGLAIAAATNGACAGVAVADDHVAPAAGAPVAAAAAAPVAAAPAAPAPAIADSDPKLKYVQAGKVVTITKDAKPVAKVTLKSASFAKSSAKAVLSVDATRPFTINPAMFTLYDLKGWENDPQQTKPVRFDAGHGSLTLTFTGTPGQPDALGWVPQNGEAAVAVWERGA
ncbi:hypothetical protein JIG36_51275 [Actinoplanes sp. LDG1-06]|uniref:Uncharacterized protein n=1 Tax=Paractinoplanes ovalisporus TaxID=2810368 RepID=A0ABS2AVL7_9ACTN|nr:hypothetical protein [Actinoplanes ovalisporus]MBM2623900.1 hypothetical protein [Actinoplanes ovalisporus]